MDLSLQEFNSDYVILQNATGPVLGPMTIQLERSIVTSGTSGVMFDNNAGLIRMNEMEVTDVTAAALVSTANNGVSFLAGMKISRKFWCQNNDCFTSTITQPLWLAFPNSGRCQLHYLYNNRRLTDCNQLHRYAHDAYDRCFLRRGKRKYFVAGRRRH